MKKQILMLVLLIGMILMQGCDSIKFEGFSLGATYLNTDITTIIATPSRFVEQKTNIEGLMPIVLFNFKFN